MSKVDIQVTKEFINITDPLSVIVDSGDATNVTIDTQCDIIEIDNTQQNISITDPSNTVIVTQSIIETVEVSNGGASTAINPNIIDLIAGEALGGQRIVTTNSLGQAIYADQSTFLDQNLILGFTRAAATLGSSVSILTLGELTDASFSFTSDAVIWLGLTGLPTQTPPVSGIRVIVAQAITATKIFIRVQESLKKAS